MSKTLVGLVLALAIAGCKDKKEGGGGGGGGGGGASDKPLEMTAPALWADYTSGKYKGMDLLDRYRPGVKVTGKVKQVIGQEDPKINFNIWLDVDGQKWIDVQFMPDDPGTAAARQKGVKQGDDVTATCKIGGRTDNFILMNDCTLQ